MPISTQSEMLVRIGVFIAVLCVMAFLEALLPRKKRVLPRRQRWITNLSLVIIDSMVLRLLVPVVAVGMAAIAADKGWGLFNLLQWPAWIEIALAVIILDMLIYWQHVASHHVPLLWAVHRVHHADRDFDVTTGLRFHPIEIVLSMFYKVVCVLLLGPQIVAVFIFELMLNGSAMFNHANVALPPKLDSLVRKLVVTPDMHRVHHSIKPFEINSNYGFNLSLWDRTFGTYTAQPANGHEKMTIGLAYQQNPDPASLWWCLTWPLRSFSNVRGERDSN